MAAQKGTWKEFVVAGGVAGVVSRTAIAPIERMKIIYQVKTAADGEGLVGLVRGVVRREGVLSLWNGNMAAVIRVMPYLSIQFASFEAYSAALAEGGAVRSRTAQTLAAGSLAGCTAVAATYPLDVVRARMALQAEGLADTAYRSMADALVTIAREEGRAGLYRGVVATLSGAAPYTGLKFATYDALKRLMRSTLGVEERELPGWLRVGAGASAGLLALTFVYPFDVIRRRMQTHRGGARYPSLAAAFARIAREEGVRRGLYRGLSLNYLKTLPNVAIYLSLYDLLKARLAA